MIEVIREYIVKVPTQGQFELVFGPGGVWSKLFSRSPGFRGTSMLRDAKNLGRFLVIDLWDTESQWEEALALNMAEYSELEHDFVDWAVAWADVGVFRVQAEATVQPRGKARRRKSGEIRRGHR